MVETIKAEDLPGLVGKELEPSSWIEITQERVNQFVSVATLIPERAEFGRAGKPCDGHQLRLG